MFEEAFRKAIWKYLDSTFPSEADRAKDEIIKIVKHLTESDARQRVEKVLAEFGLLPKWIEDHFTVGSLYTDRGLVFGWWRENQVQAESLPVALSKNYFKGVPREMRVLANRNGFLKSVPLPLADRSHIGVPGCSMVSVPRDLSVECARYGWADALPLQWHRTQNSYSVDRSITCSGFWAAWKWWPSAGDYYQKNPPYPLVEKLDYCGKIDDPQIELENVEK